MGHNGGMSQKVAGFIRVAWVRRLAGVIMMAWVIMVA